jgi:hypothetical protein
VALAGERGTHADRAFVPVAFCLSPTLYLQPSPDGRPSAFPMLLPHRVRIHLKRMIGSRSCTKARATLVANGPRAVVAAKCDLGRAYPRRHQILFKFGMHVPILHLTPAALSWEVSMTKHQTVLFVQTVGRR